MKTASREGPTTTSLTFTMWGWSRLQVRGGGRAHAWGRVGGTRVRNEEAWARCIPVQAGTPQSQPPAASVERRGSGCCMASSLPRPSMPVRPSRRQPPPPEEDVDFADGSQREAVPLLLQLHLLQRADLARLTVPRPAQQYRPTRPNAVSSRRRRAGKPGARSGAARSRLSRFWESDLCTPPRHQYICIPVAPNTTHLYTTPYVPSEMRFSFS